jgi:hypothetical protein
VSLPPDRRFSSFSERGFEEELSLGLRDCTLELWNNDDAERAVQNDAERFRQYAKECHHLAERASKKDKVDGNRRRMD